MKGQVLLPTVLILGFLVMTIGLIGLFVVANLNRANYAIRLSTSALAAAESGIRDAQLRIIRGTNELNCLLSFEGFSYNYDLVVGSYKAYVCVTAIVNSYTVDSLGVAGSQKKKVRGVFDVDAVTKQLRVGSINEIQF